MAERYRLLEASVDPKSTPEAIQEAITIARWIGNAFGEMSGLRSTMEGQHEALHADQELIRSIARGDTVPGGTDFMEADSEGFEQ